MLLLNILIVKKCIFPSLKTIFFLKAFNYYNRLEIIFLKNITKYGLNMIFR